MAMWRRDTLRSRFLRSLIPERIPWFAARLYDQIARSAIETYYKGVAELVTAHQVKDWSWILVPVRDISPLRSPRGHPGSQ